MTTCRDCGEEFESEPTRIGRASTTIRCPKCRADRAECARLMTQEPDRPKNVKHCPICRRPMLECRGECMTPEEARADHVFMIAQPAIWEMAHRRPRNDDQHSHESDTILP